MLVLLIAVTNEKLANRYTNETVAHINECLREWHYLLVALAVRMERVYFLLPTSHIAMHILFGQKCENFRRHDELYEEKIRKKSKFFKIIPFVPHVFDCVFR